ncbi:MAG: hypothetical protein C4525_14425 [Desulfarculus sp.]|nr:MAG: hypothetical protein C4525_14425 [Desulfarculus sp.]
MAAKLSRQQLVRGVDGLEPYPAMLVPLAQGGFEVIFPNLPRVRSYGITRDVARLNGVETLTFELGQMVVAGEDPPRPSRPERLIPDEEEPAGSELVVLEPDKAALRRRLGLEKREKGLAMAATLGRLGRK